MGGLSGLGARDGGFWEVGPIKMCQKIKGLLDSDHAPVLTGSASKCKPLILDFHSNRK